jgi:hypothetical protein
MKRVMFCLILCGVLAFAATRTTASVTLVPAPDPPSVVSSSDIEKPLCEELLRKGLARERRGPKLETAPPIVRTSSSECIQCALFCHQAAQVWLFQCLDGGGTACEQQAACVYLHCMLARGCGACAEFIQAAVEGCGSGIQ